MKFLFFIIILVLLRNCIGYVRNFVYGRKIKFVEHLLNTQFSYTFGPLLVSVEAEGIYRGRSVNFRSYPTGLGRMSMFFIKSSKLPMQKKFIFAYPQVAEDISQEGDILVRRIGDLLTCQLAAIGEDGVVAILDALVDTADNEAKGKLKGSFI